MILDTTYRPRQHQAEIHRNLKRFNVLVCHRRFGKTVLCINELIDQALRNKRTQPIPQYGYIAPLYKQAKAVAWDYLKYYTRQFPQRAEYSSELRVDFMSRRIRLFGADNPDALRGIYLDGVVIDEPAQMAPSLWEEVIRPALSDYKGWAIFIGTPKGHNQFYKVYMDHRHDPDWFAKMYKASETNILDPDELRSAKADLPENTYNQEYECDFEAAIQGAYYGLQMKQAEDDGRIASVPIDPHIPVNTCWDLGIGDDTSIWFYQDVGKEIHWIDFFHASGEPLSHYAHAINEKPLEWGVHDVVWGEHLLPHDAQARELGTGKTRIETLEDLNLRNLRVIERQSVEDGINACRKELPKSWFDAERCEYGIESLKQYARAWDDKKKTFVNRPTHDWASHGADAFRTGCMGKRKPHVWEPLQLPKRMRV